MKKTEGQVGAFQSTLPRGERLYSFQNCPDFKNDFNPRSREGSDPDFRASNLVNSRFQSTLPRGERRYFRFYKPGKRQISIHAPARGATQVAFALGAVVNTAFQSTLPRGERPKIVDEAFDHGAISIHAPARGATFTKSGMRSHIPLFQSTLPRGERPDFRASNLVNSRFQSTLPRGERQCEMCCDFPDPEISIHAPARGATKRGTNLFPILRNFNPRSREGSDPDDVRVAKILTEFQSTLPRGERLMRSSTFSMIVVISIHAPARGATQLFLLLCKHRQISIHAPARGATMGG